MKYIENDVLALHWRSTLVSYTIFVLYGAGVLKALYCPFQLCFAFPLLESILRFFEYGSLQSCNNFETSSSSTLEIIIKHL